MRNIADVFLSNSFVFFSSLFPYIVELFANECAHIMLLDTHFIKYKKKKDLSFLSIWIAIALELSRLLLSSNFIHRNVVQTITTSIDNSTIIMRWERAKSQKWNKMFFFFLNGKKVSNPDILLVGNGDTGDYFTMNSGFSVFLSVKKTKISTDIYLWISFVPTTNRAFISNGDISLLFFRSFK